MCGLDPAPASGAHRLLSIVSLAQLYQFGQDNASVCRHHHLSQHTQKSERLLQAGMRVLGHLAVRRAMHTFRSVCRL